MDIIGAFIWMGLIILVGLYLVIFGRVEKKTNKKH